MKQLKLKSHRYSIDLPEEIFTNLKVKAAINRTSVKDIILSSLESSFGKSLSKTADYNINIMEEIKDFTNLSNQTFLEEWNSKEDDEAFSNLQKYLK